METTQSNAPARLCCSCQRSLPKTAFSKSQIARNASSRKCKECVANASAQIKEVAKPVENVARPQPPNGTYFCVVCQNIKPQECYSKTQINGNPYKRKCKDCTPTTNTSQIMAGMAMCAFCNQAQPRENFSSNFITPPFFEKRPKQTF